MKKVFSVEVDQYNPTALAYCLKKLEDNIPGFEYEWTVTVNAGGISYGVFLNIDVGQKEIVVCNQPEFGTDGDDYLEDIIKLFEEEE